MGRMKMRILYTQKDISDALGVTPGAVNNWIKRKTEGIPKPFAKTTSGTPLYSNIDDWVEWYAKRQEEAPDVNVKRDYSGIALFRDGRRVHHDNISMAAREYLAAKTGLSVQSIKNELVVIPNAETRTLDYVFRNYRITVEPSQFDGFYKKILGA